ncbi:IS66 family insertion sequence element accessory protein TnpB [Acidiferrobacter sp. SPIII_3]|uniref:IS66 family insertion sequence element accessory protein TnpB n=1 Tax=Acidiferrobacter sp. SPIII_3 TaxID=1281578 RepID=UPI0011AB6BEF|nr:IS66 family insertion sequence element accessory protein TnpB [Acidiferrobacter sp. SPIII_3]
MIAITPHMRVLVAVESVDFRVGIDGLAQRCRAVLREEPFQGTVFLFRSRSHTAIKLLSMTARDSGSVTSACHAVGFVIGPRLQTGW